MLSISTRIRRTLWSLSVLTVLFFVSCKKEKPLSKLAGFTEFSIKDLTYAFTIDEATRIIQNADSLPYQANVSALVANFKVVPNATAKVGGTIQVSGTTANNFSSPVTYDVVAEDGVTTRSYTVRVNVAKVDPNTVAWQQVTSNAGWGTFYSTTAGMFNNKFWFSGRTLNGAWGVSSSADGITWSPLAAVSASGGDSIPGVESAFASFNGKMWLLGGHIGGFGSVSNNIWSSTDGLTWTLSRKPADVKRWNARHRTPTVVFNNKLWVIGGSGYPSFNNLSYSGTPLRDVWSSSNGTDWDSVNATPAFTARSSPAVFVYKNKIWLAGGRTGAGIVTATDYQNDIWNSSDGNTWTKVSTGTSFTPRWGHQVVVYNNELFLIGGEDATGVLNDLWVSSDDGVNWTKIEAGNPRALPANFAGRAFFSAFVVDNAVWMIGGRGVKESNAYTFRNDVWKGKLVK